VIQTHGPSGTVRHAIRTYGRWRARDLRDFRVNFDFSIDKPRDIERRIRIKRTRHGYTATMYSGRHLQNKRRGHIGVWRRDRRSIRVSFPTTLLRRRQLPRYWWNAWTAYVNCPVPDQEPEPCSDNAPQRLLEHNLK
jgi:hypothetical protein